MNATIVTTGPTKSQEVSKGKEAGGNYYKKYWIATLFLLAYRLMLAFVLELGNDEAYYWLYSQKLQWNYFDHPPLVGVWIRMFTVNGWLDDIDGFVRLGAVAGCVLASFFLFKAVRLLHNERSAYFAALLYQVSFYAGITAGLYILPDAPQMVFWTFSFWMIARISRNEMQWSPWLLLGLGTGLTIMSKVHGVFIVSGFGLWVLWKQRSWLRLPQLWLSLLIVLVVASPILFWNLHYDFITYRFHSRRVELEGHGLNFRSFSLQFLSQVGFNNPANFVLALCALVALFKGRLKQFSVVWAYTLIGLPLALVLLAVSLFRDTTLPHWSGPAFVSFIPMTAIWLSGRTFSFSTKALRWSVGVYLISYTCWAIGVQFFPGTYSKDKANLGVGDITVDMFGWRDASSQYAEYYKQEVAGGRLKSGIPLVTSHWWGAHVEYYFAQKTEQVMIGMHPEKLHHYLWMNGERLDSLDLSEAICIVPSGDKYRVPRAYYSNVRLLKEIDIERNGLPAHRFYVYHLSGLKNNPPLKY